MANPVPSHNSPSPRNLMPVSDQQEPPKNPWRRYFARLIDNLLVCIVSIPSIFFFALIIGIVVTLFGISPDQLDKNPLADYGSKVFGVIIASIWSILYETVLLATWGTTVGKRLFGLCVRNADGQKLTWWQAFKRSLYINGIMDTATCVPILGLIFNIGFMLHQRRKLLASGYTSWDRADQITVSHI